MRTDQRAEMGAAVGRNRDRDRVGVAARPAGVGATADPDAVTGQTFAYRSGVAGRQPRTKRWGARHRQRGYTLIELMIVVAIIGILAAIAIPSYNILIVRARVAEGFSLMAATRPAIVEHFASHKRLPDSLEALGLAGDSTDPDFADTVTDRAAFSAVYGYASDLWSHVEWQLKSTDCPAPGACGALVLRTIGSSRTNNVDIGLHLQVRGDDSGVRFRCIVNGIAERMPFVPANCRSGGADDYTTW